MVLYLICPKCGYERKPHEKAPEESCPSCGLIFAKYKAGTSGRPESAIEAGFSDDSSLGARAKALLLHVPDEVDQASIILRAVLFAGLVIYGVRLAAMDIPSWERASSLIHLPMVPIHEFGHVLFSPFGEFLMLLGGSLFQVSLPLIFGGIFLAKNRDPFAASVMLWWSAVAVMDVAPYMYDAAHPQHVLLTGRTGETGAHDFIDVLYDVGLLQQARAVGYAAHAFGVAMLVIAFAWGGYVLYRQYLNRGL